MALTFGSLFAGIEGFGLGFERAGMTCTWQVEIDAFARRVLERHWPHVHRHDDVTTAGRNNLTRVDVVCGGFPCQDISIAGRREGLAGKRSGLFFQMARILRELQPTWAVIENVDGLLSSHAGADFGVILRELEDVGYVAGAWRVLDSRWFGVPQRRNRVFLVGCLRGSGRRPESVLFESARGSWDSPPRREARARIANGARDGVAFALRQDPGGIGQAHNTNFVADAHVAPTLSSSGTGTSRTGNERTEADFLIVGPLGGGDNGIGRRNEDDPNLVVGSLMAKSQGGWRCGADEAGGNQIVPAVHGVRRLTPTECERLQGFPDGWTCLCGCEPYSTSACRCKDGPRYRVLGNAVTVPVIKWIGERLMEAVSDVG